jgi:hypothetical protein
MPPMATTREPDTKEEDEDEMVFIAAWCCVASEDLSSEPVYDDHEKEEDEDEMAFVSA